MKGCAGGCLERVLALVVLAVLVAAAWRFGPDAWDRVVGDDPGEAARASEEASPELAELAMERLRGLTSGEADSASFSGAELESLLRHRGAEHLPPGVTNPRVSVRNGEVRLGAELGVERLPRLPELDRLRDVLPEEVPVELRGTLLTLEDGRTVYLVHRIAAAGVPIPRRLHGEVLEAVGPGPHGELPPGAVEIPLPRGIRSLHAVADHLVVRASP